MQFQIFIVVKFCEKQNIIQKSRKKQVFDPVQPTKNYVS